MKVTFSSIVLRDIVCTWHKCCTSNFHCSPSHSHLTTSTPSNTTLLYIHIISSSVTCPLPPCFLPPLEAIEPPLHLLSSHLVVGAAQVHQVGSSWYAALWHLPRLATLVEEASFIHHTASGRQRVENHRGKKKTCHWSLQDWNALSYSFCLLFVHYMQLHKLMRGLK